MNNENMITPIEELELILNSSKEKEPSYKSEKEKRKEAKEIDLRDDLTDLTDLTDLRDIEKEYILQEKEILLVDEYSISDQVMLSSMNLIKVIISSKLIGSTESMTLALIGNSIQTLLKKHFNSDLTKKMYTTNLIFVIIENLITNQRVRKCFNKAKYKAKYFDAYLNSTFEKVDDWIQQRLNNRDDYDSEVSDIDLSSLLGKKI